MNLFLHPVFRLSFYPLKQSIDAMRRARKAILRGTATIALLGLSTGLGTVLETSPVRAYEVQLSVTIDQEPEESFSTLVKRAEVVARAAVQRSFDADILATEAMVFVNAQRGGLEAPLLSVQISRFQWNQFPDARRWATYYPSTRTLLRMDDPLILPTAIETPTIAEPTTPAAPGIQLTPPDTLRPITIPTSLPTSLPAEEQG